MRISTLSEKRLREVTQYLEGLASRQLIDEQTDMLTRSLSYDDGFDDGETTVAREIMKLLKEGKPKDS